MPANALPPASYTGDYPAPKKYALVISCVDARLLDDLVRFLDRDNLTNRYYHVALAGASLCVCGIRLPAPGTPEPPEAPDLRPTLAAWKKTFNEHLLLSLKLTKGAISDVYIVEHRDCGAYREYIRDLYDGTSERGNPEWDEHLKRAHALREALEAQFADDQLDALAASLNLERDDLHLPRIRAFMMDLRGNVELMFGAPADRGP